jgi:hypothetical protein
MKTPCITIAAFFAAALFAAPAMAQTPEAEASPATGQPSAEDMQKMMALAQPNENHKLLGGLAGTWSYDVSMWMDPAAPPQKSKGTAVCKAMMDGRYYMTNVIGQMEMPGADGKMKKVTFKGMSLDGYDNVKKKFVSSWVDNMGTGIMMSEGTYDPSTKTFTYDSEVEMMPGKTTKVRATTRMVDKDHHTFEWFEDRGGQEVKTMEINYTRKK